jgi:hypothetical protein
MWPDSVLDSGLGTGHWSARWHRAPGSSERSIRFGTGRLRAKRIGFRRRSECRWRRMIRTPQRLVAGLVRDAGFDPVLVGPLSRAREFDVGTPVYNTNMSGPEVRQALGLSQAGTARSRQGRGVVVRGEANP